MLTNQEKLDLAHNALDELENPEEQEFQNLQVFQDIIWEEDSFFSNHIALFCKDFFRKNKTCFGLRNKQVSIRRSYIKRLLQLTIKNIQIRL